MRHSVVLSALTVLALGSTAACTEGAGTSGGGGTAAAAARGPIKIWLSNNKEELAWGKAMVAPGTPPTRPRQVTAEEIPAGKSSEEVIGAAITAGNAPCLIFNTSPAAVPQFQKQGGLVALDDFPDGAAYIAGAHRQDRGPVQVAGRQVLPDAVEVQPGDDLLQQGDLHEGRDRRRPTRRWRPTTSSSRTSRKIVARRRRRPRSGRRRRASSSSPGSTSTRCSPPRPAASSWSRTASRTFASRRRQEGRQLLGTDVHRGAGPQGEVHR